MLEIIEEIPFHGLFVCLIHRSVACRITRPISIVSVPWEGLFYGLGRKERPQSKNNSPKPLGIIAQGVWMLTTAE